MTCHCDRGWVCEEHETEPHRHNGCTSAGMQCSNPQCRWWAIDSPLALDVSSVERDTDEEPPR
jgi:hypothetical protein